VVLRDRGHTAAGVLILNRSAGLASDGTEAQVAHRSGADHRMAFDGGFVRQLSARDLRPREISAVVVQR
jgi:hypothetical protein